eukprot:1375791-Prymnesium_polylepis.1
MCKKPTEEDGRPIPARLSGFISRALRHEDGGVVEVNEAWTLKKGWTFWKGVFRSIMKGYIGNAAVTVHDGRAAMAASGLSKAQFFEQYGFVLLEHETAMEPHFWEQKEKLSQLYQPEIEKLVREQLELTEIIFESDGLSLTRGPKLPGATKENVKIYGQGIHSDYGLTGE